MTLLKDAYRPQNVETVMCRSLISVDWQVYLYDCDFNQMLDMPAMFADINKPHLDDLLSTIYLTVCHGSSRSKLASTVMVAQPGRAVVVVGF